MINANINIQTIKASWQYSVEHIFLKINKIHLYGFHYLKNQVSNPNPSFYILIYHKYKFLIWLYAISQLGTEWNELKIIFSILEIYIKGVKMIKKKKLGCNRRKDLRPGYEAEGKTWALHYQMLQAINIDLLRVFIDNIS